MNKELVKDFSINKIIPYEKNPRRNDHAVDVLIKEIKAVGNNDPIEVNEDFVILAGHTRLKALKKMGLSTTDILIISGLTEDQQKRYRVTSNKTGEVAEWDFEILEEDFESEELLDMGFAERKETDKLSQLQYESIYYEPEEKPDIDLMACIDLAKFQAKIEALDEYDISQEKKEILKWFAYRFIKIDFENVANYYFFNANEEEKKAIERLRLVLSDNSINGFLEDDLLKIYSYFDAEIQECETNI